MKKVLIGLVGLVLVLVVGVVVYLYVNLNTLIERGIEEFAPRYTQTSVSLGGANVSIFSGEGGLSDLVIGNPQGYKGAEAFRLGAVNVAVDTASLTTDTIVIKSVDIIAPAVTYEPGGKAGSNLQQLVRNLQQSTQGSGAKQASTDESSGGETKVIIDRLTIRDGKVAVATPLAKESLSVDLPKIEMTGIGRGQGGVNSADVLKQVIEKVTASASEVAGVSLDELKNKAGEIATDKAKEAVGGLKDQAGDKLKGLFGN